MEPKERAARFKKARTELNKNGFKTLEQVYQETGIMKSLVSDLESDMKDRGVKYQDVAKLADYYGVSVDYLVGASDIPSVDPDVQAAAKLTGLDGASIEALIALNNYPDGRADNVKGALQILNVILHDLNARINRVFPDSTNSKYPEAAQKNVSVQLAVKKSLLTSLWKYYHAINTDLSVVPSPISQSVKDALKFKAFAETSENQAERGLHSLMAEIQLEAITKEVPVIVGGKDVISLDVEEIYFSSISREIIKRLERLKPIENERELDYGDGKDADQ
jgi:transcriptional regulator with XRE-family HTH domain